MAEVTRRQLLGGAVVAGGAVIGAASLGVAPASAPTAVEPLLIRGQSLSLTSPTFKKGSQPIPGERILASARLVDATGTDIGRFFGVYMALGAATTPGAASSLEQHTFEFADGTLVGSGLGTREPTQEDTFAVIGGTGRWSGVRGTYSARQEHIEFGGSGVAEFRMTLSR